MEIYAYITLVDGSKMHFLKVKFYECTSPFDEQKSSSNSLGGRVKGIKVENRIFSENIDSLNKMKCIYLFYSGCFWFTEKALNSM